jgi:hypothetical protein
LLAVSQNAQDRYARRMAQRTKESRLLQVDMGDSIRVRHDIQFLEYDYRLPSKGRSVPKVTHRHLRMTGIKDGEGSPSLMAG